MPLNPAGLHSLVWVLVCLLAVPGRLSAEEAALSCPTPVKKVAIAKAPPIIWSRPAAACFSPPALDRKCLVSRRPCDLDMEAAKIAWKYFQNNYNPETGMVNAANGYPSTTMWDLGSSVFATLAAREFELITRKEFDDRIAALLNTLHTQKLYKGEAPNKAYNTKTGVMSDYANKPTDGIGFSALDLGRMASALNALGCLHSHFAYSAKKVIERWKYCRMINGGQMRGTIIMPATKNEALVQEGRVGYEQYAGKMFRRLGFDQTIAASYKNANASTVMIYDVPIAVDLRDPRQQGAFNFVVTESYVLDAMENGIDAENAPLVRNIYEVQKRRWQRTGIVTAVSEDNVDRPPYFVYNTIYAAGTPWNCLTDRGVDQSPLRSVSTKAAFALITMYPEDPYSSVLSAQIASAYDPEKGWYSGIYESGIGYNKVTTANTNGIILEALLYRAMGPLNAICDHCKKTLHIDTPACCETCGK
ncbi:MAG: hypothetical protein RLZZ450_4842 [Pseudomonadota bacterium]